jgi:hypothetical protein
LFEPSDSDEDKARRALAQANADRARHYQAVFLGPDGTPHAHAEEVIADLRRFCRIDQSTFDADARIHALLEGRREVAQRILTFLQIDRAEIARITEEKQ